MKNISKKLIRVAFILVQYVLLMAVLTLLIPMKDGIESWASGYSMLFIGVVFLFIVALSCNKYYQVEYSIKDRNIQTQETALVHEFVVRMQNCYSYEDFYAAIAEILEQKANSSVVYYNCVKKTILYQSSGHVSTNEKTIELLNNNYPESWSEGYYFFGPDMSRSSFSSTARGFFLSADGNHFYVFCRYTRLFNNEIYGMLFEEFKRFQERMITMNRLTEKERITHDWHHLDDIKYAFMKAPESNLRKISVASQCHPNLEEYGGFTTVIPLSEDELMVVFGDDEIKGLTSLLNMSVILNTVRIAADKHNLMGLSKLIVKSLNDVNLKDNNVALFIGIINAAEHKINYVNYGIRTAIILDGESNRIDRLPSICSTLEDTKKLELSPVQQDINAKNILLLASNNELCQKTELVRTAMFNVESTAAHLIDAVMEAISKEDSVQAENSTLLSIKVEE